MSRLVYEVANDLRLRVYEQLQRLSLRTCDHARIVTWYRPSPAPIPAYENRICFWSHSGSFVHRVKGRAQCRPTKTFPSPKGTATMKSITTVNSSAKSSKLLLSRVVLATCAAIAVAGLVGVFSASEAQALTCGRDFFGAGCVGPRGGVGFNRYGAVAVGRYGNVYAYRRGSACFWRNSQRICP
jgi:hypothetical protein